VTAEERERIEARLDAKLQELARLRAAMRRSSDGARGGELAHVDNHPGDQGSELHDEELDETTAMFLQDEEQRIAEARQALAAGTYGTCRDCGKPIPGERLEAVPEAVRCLDCQRHAEGLHRQRTPL
jgi:phage/conjugal plasmid C-4 type zinc finger TraR family protein